MSLLPPPVGSGKHGTRHPCEIGGHVLLPGNRVVSYGHGANPSNQLSCLKAPLVFRRA